MEGDSDTKIFADNIAKLCYQKYLDLPVTGKPTSENEWTLLTGIVKVEKDDDNVIINSEVVSLGIGTKCIGQTKMSKNGDILNDSHAEIMARRGFLRYLYSQIYSMYKHGSSVIFCEVIDGKCVLKTSMSFHFFTSHTPCGDASIFPKDDTCLEDLGNEFSAPLSKGNICLEDRGKQLLIPLSKDDTCLKDVGKQLSLKDDTCFKDGEKLSIPLSKDNICLEDVGKQLSSKDDTSFKDGEKLSIPLSKDNICLKDVGEKLSVPLSKGDTCLKDLGGQQLAPGPSSVQEDVDSISTEPISKTINDNLVNNIQLKRNNESLLESSKKRPKTDNTNSKKCNNQKGFMCDIQLNNKKDKCTNNSVSDIDEKCKDIYRTGAKCLPSETEQDLKLPGVGYHVVGVLRTKPGRGDPTLSLSCSDKLARWNAVGIQGALLSFLLYEPIYMSSIIIGGGCPYSETSLRRAVIDRISKMNYVNKLLLCQATEPFVDARSIRKSRPCASSIVWCNVGERSVEVSVDGRRQGVTKKAVSKGGGSLLISKRELMKQFVSVIIEMPDLNKNKSELLQKLNLVGKDKSEIRNCLMEHSYGNLKMLSSQYQKSWNEVKDLCFGKWTCKPEMLLDFTLKDIL